MCTETIFAPAATNCSAYLPGSEIIKCASIGNFVARARDLTTGKPTVMLGTKCPSITSTCRMVAPPRSTASISAPSREKSADKIEGARSMVLVIFSRSGQRAATQTYGVSRFGFAVGDGFGTGARRFSLILRFALLLMINAGRFEFKFVPAFALPVLALRLSGRLLFALRFPLAFKLSFAFLFVILLRFGLFSFAASFAFSGLVLSSAGFSTTASDASPSLAVRLMSMA